MNKSEFMSRLRNGLERLPWHEREDIINDYEEHFRIGTEMGKTEEEIARTLGSPEELAASYVDGEPFLDPEGAVQQGAAQEADPPQGGESVLEGQKNSCSFPGFDKKSAPKGYHTEYGDGWQQQETVEGYVPPASGQAPGQYYEFQGEASPDYGSVPYAQGSRTPGEKAAYTVLVVMLSILLVIPVGFGLAVALWALILALSCAAMAVAVALFIANFSNVGVILLGLASLSLAVCLFLALICYTVGAVKVFVSYFKWCARVVSGRKAVEQQ